ncbi:MAG: gluconeogenesis factor YvcK family protein [Acidobacteriota bacterium]
MDSQKLLKVVSVGGGTGLACLLQGLKHGVYDPPILEPPAGSPWIGQLTAVVTVSDDGGSSGRLREELKVLPPGDIRNCMVALSTDESLLSRLFQYRFPGQGGLRGHSFGNLFLGALTGVTGDFLSALRVSSHVLAIRGTIFPSTLQDVQLKAWIADGTRLSGETTISRSAAPILRVALSPAGCKAVPGVLEAIRNADVITVGPGSLFTSLIPNLLVKGVVQAMRKSRAVKIYISNLMTQPGETTGLSAADHLEAIHRHAGPGLFDGVILNNQPVPARVLARYHRQGARTVPAELQRIRGMGLRIMQRPLLARGSVVRHNPARLAQAVQGACARWQKAGKPATNKSKATTI